MAKKMKFERKQARQDRSEPGGLAVEESSIMPPPMEPEGKLEAAPDPEPLPQLGALPETAEKPAFTLKTPKPKLAPSEQIAAYVRSFDWSRVRATARKAIASGEMDEAQVDGAIDNALPTPEELQDMPLHHVMAIASAATPERRQQYFPVLELHAEHARNLPEAEQGQVHDHMAVLGLLRKEAPQQEMNA